jgi:hypothetical protein
MTDVKMMPHNKVAPLEVKVVSTIKEKARSVSARSDDDDEYQDAPRIQRGELVTSDFLYLLK